MSALRRLVFASVRKCLSALFSAAQIGAGCYFRFCAFVKIVILDIFAVENN